MTRIETTEPAMPETAIPPALWVLTVPEATPSLNAFANKRGRFLYPSIRAHWQARLTDAWMVARCANLDLAGFVPPPRARLTVYRHASRALDHDNFVGGLKPVLDALRDLRLITDDDPRSLTLDVRAVRAKRGAPMTLLILEACP